MSKTLFVSNLPYAVTREQLEALLEPLSPANVSMIPGRSFAYVEIEDQKFAAAMETLRNATLSGQTLQVREAEFGSLPEVESDR